MYKSVDFKIVTDRNWSQPKLVLKAEIIAVLIDVCVVMQSFADTGSYSCEHQIIERLFIILSTPTTL